LLPHISTFFKEERDYFYRRGYAKGLEWAHQEGRIEVKTETAKKMKARGFEICFIEK
jgi:hypothetical protein